MGGCSVLRESRRVCSAHVLKFFSLNTFVPNVICGLSWQRTGARACVWNQRDEGVTLFVEEWARPAAERTPMFVSNGVAGAEFLVRELGVDAAKVSH